MFVLSRLLPAPSTVVSFLCLYHPISPAAMLSYYLLPFFFVRKGNKHFLVDISTALAAYDRYSLIHMTLSIVRGDARMAATG